MSCAKTAEPIKIQFGMLSRWVEEHVLHRAVDAPTGSSTQGVSGRPKRIIKNRILGAG